MTDEPTTDDNEALRYEPLTFDNAPALAALFKERDVWRNFGYDAEPSAFALRMRLRQGDMTGLLVFRPSTQRYVAFVICFGIPGPEAELEYAIAVPDPVERRRGVGKLVGPYSTDYYFDNNLCQKLWAWGDVNNAAMIALAKACDLDFVGYEEKGRQMVDGHTKTVAVQMTKDRWAEKKARRAASLSSSSPSSSSSSSSD